MSDNVVNLPTEVQWANDSFVNLLSGLGVAGRDKFASQAFTHVALNLVELENAYRSDWIARKVVTIPAWDMTREWRDWQADPDQIELLEALEKKLCVQQKLQQAIIKARLYGGACIIIGVDAGAPEEELDLEQVTRDSLKFLHVVSRQQISCGPIIRDISSKYFGQPEYYEARNEPAAKTFEQQVEPGGLQFSQRQVRLHPSRVVRLVGMDTADQMLSDIWGDSVLQPVNDAIRMCGLVTGSLATLVSELKIDVIKVPELKSILSTTAGTNKMISRFQAANAAKSVINTILIDGNEEWQRIQASLAGVPETMMAYMQIAAGAADIPGTRFVGMSPKGLSATGESDTRNYYDRLSAEQSTILTPTINMLDEVIIRSALGLRPPEVWYEWASLWQLTEIEKAEIALKKAQAYQIDVNTAQLPPVALANARANQLIEDGVYPGLEKALEDAALEGDTIEEHNAPAPAPAFGADPLDPNAPPVPGKPGGGTPPPGGKKPGGGNPFAAKEKAAVKVVIGGKDGIEDFNPHHKGSGEGGGQFTSGSGGGGGKGSAGKGKRKEAKRRAKEEERAAAKAREAELGSKARKIAKGVGIAGLAVAGATIGGIALAGARPKTASGGAAGLLKASPTEFLKARGGSTRSAFLSATSAKELSQHRLFLSPDKKTGYALDALGDLQNVFNNGGPRGAGSKAVIDGIKKGATTLDAFDGHLPQYYAKHGFEPTGRMKFNDDYAPSGWDYGKYGRPDVVFMAYRGGKRSTIERRVGSFKSYDESQGPYFTDFDKAKAASRRQILDRKPGRGVRALDGAGAEHRRRGELRGELADADGGPAQGRARLRGLSDVASDWSRFVEDADLVQFSDANFAGLLKDIAADFRDNNPNHDPATGRFASKGGGGGKVKRYAGRMAKRYRKQAVKAALRTALAGRPASKAVEEELRRRRVAWGLRDFNPNHDPDSGQFASGGGTTTGETERAFNGAQTSGGQKLTKLRTGEVGEKVAAEHLGNGARSLNTKGNNYPIDLITDTHAVEVKTGLSTNRPDAQKWRTTIGQPSKTETAWLKTAAPAEKAAWNASKQRAIIERKNKALDELRRETGVKLKAKTIGVILNPSTGTADIHEFDGFHSNIRWSSPQMQAAYKKTVRWNADD